MVDRRTVSIIIASVGALVTIAAIVLAAWGFEAIVDGQLEDQLRLDNKKSEGFKNFEVTPIDVLMQFYMFNITNADDAERLGPDWIPAIQELGPYVYREKRVKKDIKFLDNAKQVEFLQEVTFIFDPELSGDGLSDDDVLTVINAPYLGVLDIVSNDPNPEVSAYLSTLASILSRDPVSNILFMQGTVSDLLFNGVESYFLLQMLELLHRFPELEEMFPPLPANFVPLPGGKIGFAFYPKNGTAEGPFTVYTGKGGLDNYQAFSSYKGSTHFPFWGNQSFGDKPVNYCNMVQGTDGTVFKPYIKKTDTLYLFILDSCRILYAEYQKDISHLGIDGYRFTLPAAQMLSYTYNEDNLCYCIPDESSCLGTGLISLKTCLNVPVYLSWPHFYDGSDEYFRGVTGLTRPDAEKHAVFIDVEPLTGIPLRATKRAQMNFKITNYPKISRPPVLKTLPKNVFLPLLWVDEYGELNEELAQELKDRVLKPVEIINVVQWVLLAIGLVILGAGVGLFVFARLRSRGGQTE